MGGSNNITTDKGHTMYEKLPRIVKGLAGITGLYIGTTKAGVAVVAWGEQANDPDIVAKLTAYYNRNK